MPPAKISALSLLKSIPFTFAVIFFNTIVFLAVWIVAGTIRGDNWSSTLLLFGAQFTPLTLDTEPYRVILHLFIHGSWIHLLINLYMLFFLGYQLEGLVGTRKFVLVFFLSGIAAAIGSMYWNLFTISVGASGAISGLLGFYLVLNIFFSRKSAKPTILLLGNFAAFSTINLVLPDALYADYPGLFAGVVAGIILGFISFAPARRETIANIRVEYLMIPVLVGLFLLLPGYQVRYFKFFKQVVAAEDTTRHLLKEKLTDDDMRTFIRNYHHWEEIQGRLKKQSGLPADLAPDTFKLARYIALRKQENLLKKMVVQREAYAYLDSVDRLQEVMRKYMDLEYGLWSRFNSQPPNADLESKMVKVYYDPNGVEVTGLPAAFYRIGMRDSIGQWDGPVREYDEEGNLRIKGVYKKNQRDGVFLYYSRKGICSEAGRYLADKKFGKWQTFHGNGRVATEIFYNGAPFINSVWDSLGNQLIVDGNGKEIQVYPDDVVKVVGEYRHGMKDGTWYGRYPNGDMYFEETYNQGRLVSGKSRDVNGETFVYDESSLYPMPEGGFGEFQEYLKMETRKFDSEELGHVKLSFRVTKDGMLTDITFDQRASPTLDAKAVDLLRQGPRWFPAREHGHEPVDASAYVQIEFY